MGSFYAYDVAVYSWLCLAVAVASRTSYRAAVFEHARVEPNTTAKYIIQANLDIYEQAAYIAKTKGAEIILFPEYGLFPYVPDNKIQDYFETIPDPTKIRANPCEDRHSFKTRPTLYRLSCMAKHNSIYVVANTADIQSCHGEKNCPADGVFHYNTNVVFHRDGTLILKYYKEHLFFEDIVDLPKEQQTPIFETDFGTFATYICFDIDFSRMGEVGRRVDAVLFSTMWFDAFPQFVSVQYWQSWSAGNNVTLLAANINNPNYWSVGSGIFHPTDGHIAYTHNPDGVSKLIVADVPRRGYNQVPANTSVTAINATDVWDYKEDDSRPIPSTCSSTVVKDRPGYRCNEARLEEYTFVKLVESSGHVKACNKGMCCSLDYSTVDGFGDESFYLGVFNGSYNALDKYFWCEEDCILARCDASQGGNLGDIPCGVFPTKASAAFKSVYLRANFSTDTVYPQVLGSGIRLLPRGNWQTHFTHLPDGSGEIGSVHFESGLGERLISVGMKGRCYGRDPPYNPLL